MEHGDTPGRTPSLNTCNKCTGVFLRALIVLYTTGFASQVNVTGYRFTFNSLYPTHDSGASFCIHVASSRWTNQWYHCVWHIKPITFLWIFLSSLGSIQLRRYKCTHLPWVKRSHYSEASCSRTQLSWLGLEPKLRQLTTMWHRNCWYNLRNSY